MASDLCNLSLSAHIWIFPFRTCGRSLRTNTRPGSSETLNFNWQWNRKFLQGLPGPMLPRIPVWQMCSWWLNSPLNYSRLRFFVFIFYLFIYIFFLNERRPIKQPPSLPGSANQNWKWDVCHLNFGNQGRFLLSQTLAEGLRKLYSPGIHVHGAPPFIRLLVCLLFLSN
jgi:hypothetical protein